MYRLKTAAIQGSSQSISRRDGALVVTPPMEKLTAGDGPSLLQSEQVRVLVPVADSFALISLSLEESYSL